MATECLYLNTDQAIVLRMLVASWGHPQFQCVANLLDTLRDQLDHYEEEQLELWNALDRPEFGYIRSEEDPDYEIR